MPEVRPCQSCRSGNVWSSALNVFRHALEGAERRPVNERKVQSLPEVDALVEVGVLVQQRPGAIGQLALQRAIASRLERRTRDAGTSAGSACITQIKKARST